MSSLAGRLSSTRRDEMQVGYALLKAVGMLSKWLQPEAQPGMSSLICELYHY